MVSFALRGLGVFVLSIVLLTALHFPTSVDGPAVPTVLIDDAEDFYEAAYTESDDGKDSKYVQIAQQAGHVEDVEPKLRAFVERFGLEGAKTLEIGAGSGTLQDVVSDYTGLDIASSAARYFRKPFVHGSATDLPFGDDEFDLCWSIWTLEHVPNPEQALTEMRRVTRPGGYLYLYPAWNNPTWAPKGYPVRPDSELNWQELVSKYSLLIREMPWFKQAYRYPTRLVRLAAAQAPGAPTQLHYHELDANFDTYWMPDSDAVNSIDCYEAQLWFRTRGDEVVDAGTLAEEVFKPCGPIVVRVNKG